MSLAPMLRRLAIPLTAAITAWVAVPFSFWQDARSPLLTALSVLAAAVLVRLARGLPFTNADHFEVDEIRKVTAAMKQIMAALAVLITVIFGSMLLIVFSNEISIAIARFTPNGPIPIPNSMSALLALLLVYVFSRLLAVVRGDLNLVDLQSKFLVRAVERKQGEEQLQSSPSPVEYKSSESYGRLQ